MIDQKAAQLRQRAAVGCHIDAADEDARHIKAVGREMTAGATLRPDDVACARRLRQCLKDHTLPWIVRRDFDYRRAWNVSDGDAIVEVEGAGIFRRDLVALERGFGSISCSG